MSPRKALIILFVIFLTGLLFFSFFYFTERSIRKDLENSNSILKEKMRLPEKKIKDASEMMPEEKKEVMLEVLSRPDQGKATLTPAEIKNRKEEMLKLLNQE